LGGLLQRGSTVEGSRKPRSEKPLAPLSGLRNNRCASSGWTSNWAKPQKRELKGILRIWRDVRREDRCLTATTGVKESPLQKAGDVLRTKGSCSTRAGEKGLAQLRSFWVKERSCGIIECSKRRPPHPLRGMSPLHVVRKTESKTKVKNTLDR